MQSDTREAIAKFKPIKALSRVFVTPSPVQVKLVSKSYARIVLLLSDSVSASNK